MNKMTFHQQKCKVVSVAKNGFETIMPFQLFIYELGGTILDYASSEKYLGLIVNTTLTFDDQCDDRYSTMNQKLGLLRRQGTSQPPPPHLKNLCPPPPLGVEILGKVCL